VDDHKVSVQPGDVPGYLSDVVQSGDGSVLVTVSDTGKLDLRMTGIGRGSDRMALAIVTGTLVAIPDPYTAAFVEYGPGTWTIEGIDPTGFGSGQEATLVINATPTTVVTISPGVHIGGTQPSLTLLSVAGTQKPVKLTNPTTMKFLYVPRSNRWQCIGMYS
jgi:hypothetical protein